MTSNDNEALAWQINYGILHKPSALHNGIVAGYSANGSNLIVENITTNDDRNSTQYRCVIIIPDTTTILRESEPTILYVAGECQYNYRFQFYNHIHQSM